MQVVATKEAPQAECTDANQVEQHSEDHCGSPLPQTPRVVTTPRPMAASSSSIVGLPSQQPAKKQETQGPTAKQNELLSLAYTETTGQDEYIHTSAFDLISPKAGHPVTVTHPRSDPLIQERHILQRKLPSINGVDTASEDKSEPMEDYSLLGDLPLWQIQAEEPLLQERDQVNCDFTNDAYLKQNGGYLTKFLFTLSKEEEDKMSTQATPDEEFGGHPRSRVRRHSKKKKGGYGMGMMMYQMMPQVIHVNLQISHAPSCGCGCGGCYHPPPPPPPQPCGQCGCGGCRPVCNVCNG
uniref:Uncharacterized protein n=1 Tax=Timema shepardi TaxID=629360 RepID=A0A7R9AQR7_TIMSH|nr:unnamed protein product [Timema shepardi]